MIYTKEVRKELDNILKAFENYIDSQNYFDIVYSKKVGYLWIVVDPPGAAGTEQLDTPEVMLQDLLVALHDLDCPWRPGDVGRILRIFKIKKNVEVTDNGKDDF